ncbi:MAG: phosphodiester glycosidase family protein [Anaerolineaceae bacterium]
MGPSKRKTKFFSIAGLILALGGVLYLLADRYLIEHIEIANVSVITSTQTVTASAGQGSGTLLASVVSFAGQEEDSSPAEIIADDWNYQSETTSIAVRQVTTGNDRNTLTYYVAEVILSDGVDLSSAFAKDSFGLNIIEDTSVIAQNNNAVFAINGDYYGFREDGIEIRNGVIYRDQAARVGLAIYKDGTMKVYNETTTTAQQLLDAGVWNTLSFGPALVENGQVYNAASRVEVDNNLGNHSIQGNNPRTGLGIISPGHFVFVVVDGRSAGYSRGASLTEFAQIFKDLGCTDAYNMDGGGSSTMYFMGRVVNNPLGRGRERGTSDILYVGS